MDQKEEDATSAMYNQNENSSTQGSDGHRMPQIGVQGMDFFSVINLLRAKAWIVASVAIASRENFPHRGQAN